IIMSIFKPEFTWLATGGISGLNWKYIKHLKGYKIIAFPDKNAYTLWEKKAIELRKCGLDISVSKFIEDRFYPNNTDLADIFIENMNDQICKKATISEIKSCNRISGIDMMVEKLLNINPAISKLIETFDLTYTNGSEINTSLMKERLG
ncbi:MAG TPA: DUF6371 domain-containing protein, partial [Salinimicrobium sp.]|nr:DUF6371 domain-containing protein [Salinimicrobium sp.]